MKRRAKKEDKYWKNNLPKLNNLLKRKEDENKLIKCPHLTSLDRCKRGGFVSRCVGMSKCDYYKDLKRR